MKPMDSVLRETDGLRHQVIVSDNHVLDLRTLVVEIWRWKWLLVLCLLLGAAYGLRDLRGYTPEYEAKMLVAPAEGSGEFSLGGGGGGRGGLNTIVQSLVSGGGGKGASTFDRLSILFSSVALAEELQRKHGLMQVIFKGSWDPVKQDWIRPDTSNPGWREKLRAYFHFNPWHAPDIQSLANYIGAKIKIDQKEDTAFRTITVRHPNREFAFNLLETAYFTADELLRRLDRVEVERRKSYILRQLEQTTLVDSRAALIALLAGEERKAMLLNSDLPYAARVMEPPRVSAQPLEPSVPRIVGLPMAVAGALGFVVIALIAAMRRE